MALVDRDTILVCITKDNPTAATELDLDFEAKAENARLRPSLYKAGRVKGTREIVVRPSNVMIYRESGDVVEVLRVLRATQQATTMTQPGKAQPEEDRKAPEDQPPSAHEGTRALGIASLVEQVQTMIEASGNPEGFDAAKWVARWLDRPLPALGGQKPAELMDKPDGRAKVQSIVASMQSCVFVIFARCGTSTAL